MAGKTISQLPLATTPLAGTESVPIVRSGVTYKTTVADVAKSPQDGATANAVTYYDGNKMPASNSGFRYDGTNVIATGTVSVAKLIPTGSSVAGTGMYLPASNTIGFSTNGTLGLVQDASQNLGLGATPSAWALAGSNALQVKNAGFAGYQNRAYLFANAYFNSGGNSVYIASDYATTYEQSNGQHVWKTAPSGTAGNAITFTQAMTLDASGNLVVGDTSTAGRVGAVSSVNNKVLYAFNTAASGFTDAIVVSEFRSYAPNNTTARFLYCGDTSAERCSIRSNGGIANFSGNNVNLSDRREKTNFAPAGDYLSKICAIPVQTFNYIDQNMEDDPGTTLGVVAQDVQAVAPELVMESNWGTTEEPKMRLSIYQTDLQYALMKCVQEQQAIIEQLTARVVALEAKQAA